MTFWIIWLLGALSVFLSHAYLGGKLWTIVLFYVAVFWPISLPILGFIWLYKQVEQLGKKHRQQRAERQRIRIAEEKQQRKLLEDAEQEVNSYVENLRTNQR